MSEWQKIPESIAKCPRCGSPLKVLRTDDGVGRPVVVEQCTAGIDLCYYFRSLPGDSKALAVLQWERDR